MRHTTRPLTVSWQDVTGAPALSCSTTSPNGVQISLVTAFSGCAARRVTGKSTIARTVAHDLDNDGVLGASFFFRRGHADGSHARLVFPKIARQFADRFQEVSHAVAEALDRDSLVCSKQLRSQCEQLLSLPFQGVTQLRAPSAGIALSSTPLTGVRAAPTLGPYSRCRRG